MELLVFEPLEKMKNLENWEFRESESLDTKLHFAFCVLGFGLSCHFLVEKAQGEIEKKYSDFRERKTSFGNQEV